MIWGPRAAGLLLGLILAAGVVLNARPAAGPPSGLDLRVTANRSGEVEVLPVGTVLTARSLRPGGVATGELQVRNITAVTLGLRPSITGGRELDRSLRVSLSARGRTLFRGTLGALRAGGGDAVTVRPAGAARLQLRAWVPAGRAHADLAGRTGDLVFTFSGTAAR